MSISFHQTFKPEANYLSQIIIASKNSSAYTLEELSNITGIPQGASSGKLLPHLYYAKYMGLLTYILKDSKYFLSLTPLGEIIYEEDLGLHEKFTLLLLHCMLVRPQEGAEVWSYLFIEFQKKYGGESRLTYLKNELNNHFSTNVKLGPTKSSYEHLFGPLNLIEFGDDQKIDTDFIRFVQQKYDSDFIYLYALVIYEYWNIYYPSNDEITNGEFNKMGVAEALCFNDKQIMHVLDELSERGIIRLNKQLMPFTILKISDQERILTNLYSELC